ncbi:MAG: hypothetical protein H6502_01925 [Candidatus Woesearchaeota archaeon]|nr:MAG: hypothetical protein H6502_01925 [Candidatus Woesearchaeota archaeon]
MDVSNRTLAMILVAALVVSLGGTMMSLNLLSSMSRGGTDITGFASLANGSVLLNVSAQASITLLDSDIDFGNCQPQAGANSTITSDDSNDTASVCTGFNADQFDLQNNGNVQGYVNVTPSKTGEAQNTSAGYFILDSQYAEDLSWLAYKTTETGDDCAGTLGTNGGYVNFTAGAMIEHVVCDDLDPAGTLAIDVAMMVPSGVNTGRHDFNLTFTVTQA